MTAESKELGETEIRRVMNEQENAVRASSVEGVMSKAKMGRKLICGGVRLFAFRGSKADGS